MKQDKTIMAKKTDITTAEYRAWLESLKANIRRTQIKAAVSVNRELLHLYWQLGKEISEKQAQAKWGDGFIAQLSRDLAAEFPDIKGFSKVNLWRTRKWYQFYFQKVKIVSQVVPQLQYSNNTAAIVQHEDTILEHNVKGILSENIFFSIPWGHHIAIMQKCKDLATAQFYIEQTVANNWSRATLKWHLDSNLHERQGNAITNFRRTLPAPQSDLAQQITKDPYIVDVMGINQEMTERELESYLDSHIAKYLLELGAGFTYYGHQVKVMAGGEEFYIDQLFYHVKLHCYVVVELKATKFRPEHVGQLNFYVSAVDSQFKTQGDNPTIGLLICKDKNEVVAEYSLQNVVAPIGVSSMKIYDSLTENYKSSLPSIEEIENSLKELDE